jgi:hypothetical protein
MVVIFIASLQLLAQEVPTVATEKTTPPTTAKYEIVQSPRAMKETYLLDRYTGQTWTLVKTDKRPKWEAITAEVNLDDIKPSGFTGPLYQISISGVAAKGTYLINTATGATWILFSDPEQGKFWGAITKDK